MPDYTPPFINRTLSLTASAAVTGGQVVEVSGKGTIKPCATAGSVKAIGVALHDSPVNGRVTVTAFGPVHETPVATAATVTAGDQIQTGSAPAGSVQTAPPSSTPATEPAVYAAASTVADISTARSIIGVALTTATAPAKVRWVQCL